MNGQHTINAPLHFSMPKLITPVNFESISIKIEDLKKVIVSINNSRIGIKGKNFEFGTRREPDSNIWNEYFGYAPSPEVQFSFIKNGYFYTSLVFPNLVLNVSKEGFIITKGINIGGCNGLLKYIHYDQKILQTEFFYRRYCLSTSIPLENGSTTFEILKSGTTYNILASAYLGKNLQSSKFFFSLYLNHPKTNFKLYQSLSYGPLYYENVLYQISSKYYAKKLNVYNSLLLFKVGSIIRPNFVVGLKNVSPKKIIDRVIFTRKNTGETTLRVGNALTPGNGWKLKWEINSVILPILKFGVSIDLKKLDLNI